MTAYTVAMTARSHAGASRSPARDTSSRAKATYTVAMTAYTAAMTARSHANDIYSPAKNICKQTDTNF